jgi:hypothetical protein
MMFRLPRLAPPEQTPQLTRIGRSTDGGMIGLLGLIDIFEFKYGKFGYSIIHV